MSGERNARYVSERQAECNEHFFRRLFTFQKIRPSSVG